MSGHWEVVSKHKQKHALSKSEKKKILERAPKIEEMPPISQEEPYYTALDKENTKPNKENTKPNKENNSKQNNSKQNNPRKNKVKQEKKEPGKKSSNPKNLDGAMRTIIPKELLCELAVNQAKYKGTPLVWLRSLVSYLNRKLNVECPSPVFAGKPWDYPLCLLQGSVRDVLKTALKEAGTDVMQPFFEWCLLAMATDMSRSDKGDGPIMGYKLCLQLIATNHPEVTVADIDKAKELLNSYQNRQNIGLSILWALGLGGYRDINIGFQVWQDVMVHIMEMRNYTSYVISYLHSNLSCKYNTKPVKPDELFKIMDMCLLPPSGLPTAHKNELLTIVPLLVNHISDLVPEDALIHVFVSVLERMKRSKPALTEMQKKEFVGLLSTCLYKDPSIYSTWRRMYESYLPQSALLLHHLRYNVTLPSKPSHNRYLRETLRYFQAINEKLLLSNPSEPHLQKCHQLCSDVKSRMSVARPFPWMMANLVLLALIGALLTYDIQRHGSFDASSTGHLLRDVGALPYVKQGSSYARDYYLQAHKWLVANGPRISNDIYNATKPVVDVAWKGACGIGRQSLVWWGIGQEFATEKMALAADWMNEHMPGWKEQLSFYASETLRLSAHVAKIGAENLFHYSEQGIAWARTNVFVGSWSPDNLHQQFEGVLNSTQHYATWTYDWICQKVQILSKVQ